MNAKRFPLRFWVNWSVRALVLTCCSKIAFAGSPMQYYVSEVDGSEQPYGLYIPEPFDPQVPHPVVFSAHSYGNRAWADFPDTVSWDGVTINLHRRSYADAKGWILVNLDGRGDTWYEGIGENDFFRVLDELRATYKIDENRIYLTGPSMGGTGAFGLGFRHPDVFAAVSGTDGAWDYRWYHRAWYASISDPTRIEPSREPLLQSGSAVDIAENGKHLAMHMIVDTNDWDVLAGPNGQALHIRLNELGYLHSYNEKSVGHMEGYDCVKIYDFFSQHINEPNPKDVVLKTNQLKYGSAYWVRIDRLEKKLAVDRFAKIEAKITGKDRDKVEVTASDLLQYTLFLTTDLMGNEETSIQTNGQLSYSGPVGEVTTYASLDESGNIVGWSTEDSLPCGLRKTPQIEGPIGHAYTSRFLLVKGTIGSKSENARSSVEAQKFASERNSWMHADISPVTDTSVTEDDIASSNLCLYGTADSNLLIKEINDFLPIRIWRNRIAAGANVYEGDNYGLYMIFPNPLNPEKYVVISHGTIQGSRAADLECLPWYWPDYVIFDTNIVPDAVSTAFWHPALSYLPDAWVQGAAGFFDQYWRMDNDEDGLDDIFEKKIIDADPDDEIASIEDVNPDDDFDGDGQTNHTEYNAGTNATSSGSVFSILSIMRDSTEPENLKVSWRTAPGRAYYIFWSDSMDGPWHDIGELEPEDVSDDGDVRTWTDKGTDPSMQGKKPEDCAAMFYRVSAHRSGRVVQ